MKTNKYIFSVILSFLSILTTAQTFNAAEYLDINNVNARFMVHGDMFWDPATGNAAYEFPKGSGKHSNFTSALWIGGIDQSTNTLKVAAQMYRNGGNDYWPGPLDENNGASIDSATSANWAQIWKVNRTTIDSFRSMTTHTIANTPKSILEWPGRGNPNAKTPMNTPLVIPTNRNMAPFWDANNDNIYNALDGDYPDIRGEQMLWWVFNDKANVKTQSGSDGIGLEIHAWAYACNQQGLENTTFLNYRIHNFSTSILDSTYVALWSDVDLGFAFDDYIGYDSLYNMGVAYNGDIYDENTSGYEYSLTQTGVALMQGPRIIDPQNPQNYIYLEPSSFTYFNNGTSSQTGDPTQTTEFYNYMTGSWRNGAFFTAGCDPSAPGTAYPYVYPGDPTASPISEVNCNRAPGDRRFVLSSGPFELYPGQIPSDITFAIINTDTGVNNANFNELRQRADSAQKYFKGCGPAVYPTSVRNLSNLQFSIFPNPTNGELYIQDVDEKEKRILMYNSLGQLILSKKESNLKTSIDTKSWPKGLYYLKIAKGTDVYSQSVLVR